MIDAFFQDKETPVLVFSGEWECSPAGCWDFLVERNCLAQCVMVSECMSFAALKKRIEDEFESDNATVVTRLSYWPPAQMSMLSTTKTPPVAINSDAALNTYFKVRAGTSALNLLVTFENKFNRDGGGGSGAKNNTVRGGRIICLSGSTPSLGTKDVVDSTNDSVDMESSAANVRNGEPVVGRESGIDLNTIYDATTVAQLEAVEQIARAAQGLSLSKGKEKVTFDCDGGSQEAGRAQGDRLKSATAEDEEAHFWNYVLSNEYRALQGNVAVDIAEASNANINAFSALQQGGVMEVGETSNPHRMQSLPDIPNAEFATGEEVAALMLLGDTDAEEEIEDNGSSGYSDVDEAIQLSLDNIYNEIIEADIVPSHDCDPCFGDEYLQTQDMPAAVYDPSNDAIYIGRIFRNKSDMQTALAIYAIKRFFTFKQVRSDKERLIVRCVDMLCPWRVYSHTADGDSENMVVRTETLTHTCSVETRSQYGKKASCKVIAEVLKSKYANGKLGPRAVDIPDIVREELRVSITYMKAWHSKEKAVLEARGCAADSYKLLMVYLHLLKKANPGTVYDVVSTKAGTARCKFKYLFFAIGACIHAAKFMRRVLIIDATTIKAKFRGTLLTASFQDGNFQIMPLAFGVVDSENELAWTWFFRKLVEIVPDADDLVFVLDRHNSIYAALRTVYPLARHGACAVHLYRNVKSRYARQQGLAHLVSKAACAYTVGEFRTHFQEIESRSPLCANYLRDIGISHWTRVYFQGKRYNIMSSNVAESLNAALAKALEFPIVSMVETIRMMLMRWFYCRRVKAEKHLSPVTPEVEEILMKNLETSADYSVTPASTTVYQVKNKKGVAFIVDLERKGCTCKVFETLGIPCSHALAAARVNGTPIPVLVDQAYKVEDWRSGYSVVVMPVPNAADEDVPEEMLNAEAGPPNANRGPGRPRKRRILSRGEETVRRTDYLNKKVRMVFKVHEI